MLNIKPVELETITKMYQDPKERFYRIILAFLRQAEPPPTWRAIVNALKSPVVNLTALAKRVEAAHFPDPTVPCDPETTSGESANTPNTSQSEPPTMWRAIFNALKNPIVNLTALARVEAAHFPDLTASPDPPTTSGESVTDVSNTQFIVVSCSVKGQQCPLQNEAPRPTALAHPACFACLIV